MLTHSKRPLAAAAVTAAAAAARGPVAVQLLAVEAQTPHRDAFYHEQDQLLWTYRDLASHSFAVGRAFSCAFGRPDALGHRVLLRVDPSTDLYVAALGLPRAGITPVFDNTAHADGTLLAALDRTQPSGLIVTKDRNDRFDELYATVRDLEDWPCAVPLRARKFEYLRMITHTSIDRWPGLLALRDFLSYQTTPDPLDAVPADRAGAAEVTAQALLEYSPAAVAAGAAGFVRAAGIAEASRIGLALDAAAPPTAAVAAGPYAAVTAGAAVVVDPGSHTLPFVDVLVASPANLERLLSESSGKSGARPRELREVVVVPHPGDAPAATADLLRRVSAAWSPVKARAALCLPGLFGPAALRSADEIAAASVGDALVAAPQLRIADRATGAAVAAGGRGRLQVRGAAAASGGRDGWVDTGAEAAVSSTGALLVAN